MTERKETINLRRRLLRLAIPISALFTVSACGGQNVEELYKALFSYGCHYAYGSYPDSCSPEAPYDQTKAGTQDTGTAADTGGGGNGNGE